ncbi:gem-associated protein 7 [Anser cygnoides]|uniref:gem-associated protein 7 n=1 Tax=Anser cygnoides TaxID=8845 RepID=UPI0034D2721B
MAVPVSVLRLPRGPEGSSRGFSPASPRFRALLLGGGTTDGQKPSSSPPQAARAALRRRYLRSLAAMRGLPVSFALHERVRVGAVVAAADAAPLAFQVDALRTPLGLQAAALLRCADIIAYAFELPPPATPERGDLPQNKRDNGGGGAPERGNLPQSRGESGSGGAPERGNLPQNKSENGSRPSAE